MKKNIINRIIIIVRYIMLILSSQVVAQRKVMKTRSTKESAILIADKMQRWKQLKKHRKLIHNVIPSRPANRLTYISELKKSEVGILRVSRIRKEKKADPDREVVELQKSTTVFEQVYKNLANGTNAEKFDQAIKKGDMHTAHSILSRKSGADVRLLRIKEGDTWETFYDREVRPLLEKKPECTLMCVGTSRKLVPSKKDNTKKFTWYGYSTCMPFCK